MNQKYFRIFQIAIICFLSTMVNCKRSTSTHCLTSAQSATQTHEHNSHSTVFGKGQLIISHDYFTDKLLEEVFAIPGSSETSDAFNLAKNFDAIADNERIKAAFNVPVHFAMTKFDDNTYSIRVFGNYMIDAALINALRIKLVVSMPQLSRLPLEGSELALAESVFETQANVFNFDQDGHSSAFVEFNEGKLEVLRYKHEDRTEYRKITGEESLAIKLKDIYGKRLSNFLWSIKKSDSVSAAKKSMAFVGTELYFSRGTNFFYDIEDNANEAWCEGRSSYSGGFPSDGLCSPFFENHAFDFELSEVPETEKEKEKAAKNPDKANFQPSGSLANENAEKAGLIFDNLMNLRFRSVAALSSQPETSENYAVISENLEEKLMRNQFLLNALANNGHFLSLAELYYFHFNCKSYVEDPTLDYYSLKNSWMSGFCGNHENVLKYFTAGLQFYDIFGELLNTPQDIMRHLKLGLKEENTYGEINVKVKDFAEILQKIYDTNENLPPLGKLDLPNILGQKLNAHVSERAVIDQVRDEFIKAIELSTDSHSEKYIPESDIEDPIALEGMPSNPIFKILYLRHKILRKLATENYLALSQLMESEFKETTKKLPLYLETALYETNKFDSPLKGIFSFPVNLKDKDDLQALSPDAFALKQKFPELIQPQQEFILNNQNTAHFLASKDDQLGSSIYFQFTDSKFEMVNFHNTRQMTSPLLVAGRYVLGFPLTVMGLDENGGAIAIEQGYIPPQEVEGITYKSSAPEAAAGNGGTGDASQGGSGRNEGNIDTAESGPAPCKK